jgi:hypothetical protein
VNFYFPTYVAISRAPGKTRVYHHYG